MPFTFHLSEQIPYVTANIHRDGLYKPLKNRIKYFNFTYLKLCFATATHNQFYLFYVLLQSIVSILQTSFRMRELHLKTVFKALMMMLKNESRY